MINNELVLIWKFYLHEMLYRSRVTRLYPLFTIEMVTKCLLFTLNHLVF